MLKARYAPHFTILCLISPVVSINPMLAASRGGAIEGRISKFECGDNCYLTIVDAAGKEHTGLCTAPECATWNRNVFMPPRFRGKKVLVSTGQGVQVDGSGNVMGRMTAFKKIRFIP